MSILGQWVASGNITHLPRGFSQRSLYSLFTKGDSYCAPPSQHLLSEGWACYPKLFFLPKAGPKPGYIYVVSRLEATAVTSTSEEMEGSEVIIWHHHILIVINIRRSALIVLSLDVHWKHLESLQLLMAGSGPSTSLLMWDAAWSTGDLQIPTGLKDEKPLL